MSSYDFRSLDRHRAKDHVSWIRPDSTSWESTTDVGQSLKRVLESSDAALDDGAYKLTREAFGTLLTDGDLTPEEQIVLVYAWGGPAHGNNYVAKHAQLTTDSPRDTGFKGDIQEFLCDPRQRRMYKADIATGDSETVDRLASPYHAFDKLWVPEKRWNGALQGMGTAYGTKVLYWAARAHGGLTWDTAPTRPIPLVYDLHVHRALETLEIKWVLDKERPRPFDAPAGKVRYWNYHAYCALAFAVAQHLTAARGDGGDAFLPDDVEYWLFLLSGSAGDPSEDQPLNDGDTAGGPGPEEESRVHGPEHWRIDLDPLRTTMSLAITALGPQMRVRTEDIDGPVIA